MSLHRPTCLTFLSNPACICAKVFFLLRLVGSLILPFSRSSAITSRLFPKGQTNNSLPRSLCYWGSNGELEHLQLAPIFYHQIMKHNAFIKRVSTKMCHQNKNTMLIKRLRYSLSFASYDRNRAFLSIYDRKNKRWA